MGIEIGILALLALLVVVQLVLGWQQSKRIERLEHAIAESAASQREVLESAGQAILTLHGSINVLEQRLAKSAQRQQNIESKNVSSLTYEQAAKLVQMGAAPEDLVKNCGLSQAEAKLVSLMAARGVGRVS
jgi:type II secretory pathway pseudopilin PulG